MSNDGKGAQMTKMAFVVERRFDEAGGMARRQVLGKIGTTSRPRVGIPDDYRFASAIKKVSLFDTHSGSFRTFFVGQGISKDEAELQIFDLPRRNTPHTFHPHKMVFQRNRLIRIRLPYSLVVGGFFDLGWGPSLPQQKFFLWARRWVGFLNFSFWTQAQYFFSKMPQVFFTGHWTGPLEA